MTHKPKENDSYTGAMKELRDALAARQEKAPGQPCVAIDLDKVFAFKDENGEMKAVMPVQEIIYLVDEILRR